MSTCHRLDLQTLGSQPVIMPKNLPDHNFTPRMFNTCPTPFMVFGVMYIICEGPKLDA